MILNFKTSFIFSFILFCFYLIFFFSKYKFDNYAYFGGDTWEYQSMAVNFSYGHNLKFGSIEDFHNYKFYPNDFGDAGVDGYNRFLGVGKSGGSLNFYRTPGYPIFLGIIYSIFGVNPSIAKQVQLILIIIIASFLPTIGFCLWKSSGLISGLIAGFLYFYHRGYSLSADILTEPLISFTVFLFIVFIIFWQFNPSPRRIYFLGFIFGFGLLVKGSLIYYPLLFFIYLLFCLSLKKIKFKHLIIYLIGLITLTLPWSLYASIETGKLVVLSTQGNTVILQGNNTASIDGRWHPDADLSFYSQPNIAKLPLPAQLIMYYQKYPYLVRWIFNNKIFNAFSELVFFNISLIISLYLFIIFILKKFINSKALLSLLIFLLSLITTIDSYKLYSKLLPIFFPEFPFLKVSFFLIILNLIAFLIFLLLSKKPFKILSYPISIIFTYLNFIFLTLSTFGLERFVVVADFIYTLTAIYLLILVFNNLFKTYREIT